MYVSDLVHHIALTTVSLLFCRYVSSYSNPLNKRPKTRELLNQTRTTGNNERSCHVDGINHRNDTRYYLRAPHLLLEKENQFKVTVR